MFFRLLGHCFSVCVLMVSAAQAAVVLQIDLSTVNQVTISATTGSSLASVSGSDRRGVYLKDFFAPGGSEIDLDAGLGASLVYFNATSDELPGIHRKTNDPGLNIYDMDDAQVPASFTSGVQAFKGSATWSLTAQQYAVFLQAPTSGDIYAFADSIDDLDGGPQLIGQYSVGSSAAVPEPTSMAIFGLGALGMAYRARRKCMV
ncbi:MAG: PEP-CTERM sorting domain-containing protein [Planctomycetota bacterium]|nr:PEP-CTERM sorting domain-containing protein [Planctomycetota bacterium]